MIFIFENANNIKKVISISKSIYKSIIFIYLPKVFLYFLLLYTKYHSLVLYLLRYIFRCVIIELTASPILSLPYSFFHNLIPFKIRYNRRLNLYVTYVMQPIKKLQFFSFFSLFFIKINFLPKLSKSCNFVFSLIIRAKKCM